jgi:hypothetical protein
MMRAGYFVQVWVGRWSVAAFWSGYDQAERHRKQIIRSRQWRGRVPQIVRAT